MDKGILLRTKTLVIFIHHYIRAYFPYVTPRGDITFPAFFIVVVFKMAANSRFVELNKKTKQVDTRKHFKVFLTWCEVCCVLYLVSASAVLVRKLFFTIKTSIFIVIVSLYKISPYNKQNILRWRGNMDFMFSWQQRYLCCHSNIKSIFPRHREISYMYFSNLPIQFQQ